MEIDDLVNSISKSLPISFGSEDADNYIRYVKSACIENYRYEKYQFSFLAFHLLYMCYIYKELWQGNLCNVSGLEDKIRQKCNHAPYDSPFRLSVIPEKEVIPFLNHFGFHQNKTRQFSSSVEWRDNCAHASGFVQYSKGDVEANIFQVLAYIKEIEAKKKSHVTGLFERHFSNHFKPDDPGSYFPSGLDSVDAFIKSYLLSMNDLLTIIDENKNILEKPSSLVETLYKKVFFILILGWAEQNNEPFEEIRIDTALEKLKEGIEKQDVTTLSDLISTELSDIVPLLSKEIYANIVHERE